MANNTTLNTDPLIGEDAVQVVRSDAEILHNIETIIIGDSIVSGLQD